MKEFIHFAPDEMYEEYAYCYNFTLSECKLSIKESEITCPKCLAKLWLYQQMGKTWDKIYFYCKRHHCFSEPWKFLEDTDNKDLFWKFLKDINDNNLRKLGE